MRSHSRRQAAGGGLIRPRTISGQLARILAVSLVLVLVLLGVTMSTQITAFRRSGETVDAVAVALAAQDLVHQVQRERGLSNGLLGGDTRLVQAVGDQRPATDSALRTLSAALTADVPGAGEVRSALGQLGGLPGVRSQIDTRTVSRQAAFQFYSDGIDALNRLALGLDQARDPAVRHGLQALYALGDAKEFTARERGFLNGVFAAGEFVAGEYVQFLDIRAARTAALTQFDREATPTQRDRLTAVMSGESATRAAESENIAIASTAGPLTTPVDPAVWWSQMTEVIDAQRTVQQAVGDDVRARAADLRRTAAVVLAAFALAALLAIAAEVALVFASVRAIVRPLAELAAEADDVASTRLPEVIAAWRGSADTRPDPPAPVRTPPGASAEIGAVADALDRVQSTAFDLASEQALVRRNTTESMANLARRNQNLVRRQLGLISEFEREELDPKTLSNLFELDHLATRMRRNAESLLVLVGEASPRRWTEPIALTDVIRAGLSEVDDYRRVVLRRVDEVAITGTVVSELAHALAELIENGLAFSPPDLEVEIYGRKVAGGYLLAVVDHGVGMSTDQLAEANARLRGEQDFIVASTRYLGHYVVGRLAARLGIDVELNTSPVSGIVARLLLPSSLIADESSSGRPESGGARVSRPSTGSHDVDGSPDDARHSRGEVAASGAGRVPEPARRGAGHNASGRQGAGRPDDRHSDPGRNGAGVPDLDEQGARHSDPGRNGARVPDPDEQGAHISTPTPTLNGMSLPNFDQHHGRQLRVDPLNGHHPAQRPIVLPADPPGADQDSPVVPSPYIQFLTGTASYVDETTGPDGPNSATPTRAAGGPAARTGNVGTEAASAGPFARDAGFAVEGTLDAIGRASIDIDRTRNGSSRVPSGLDLSPGPRGTRGDGVSGDLDVPGQASVERTRNGLVKRAKRATPPDRPRREPARHDRPPLAERTPDQTRSMLAAFRTGHESGSGTSEADPIR
ncbi:nitrate- and nitrite sensing domain-containing protein [Nocardia sp. GTS18]|uniref:sensor histidine kinase n=1 Tax=Nocardia sp. GTS18 TaxID=1778064 RepID=UPI0015EF7F6C